MEEVRQVGNLTEDAKRDNPSRRRVYDSNGLSPTLQSAMGEGGNLQPFIVEEQKEKRLGNIYGFDGGNYAGNVCDKDSLSPTIRTYQGGNQQPMIVDSKIELKGRAKDLSGKRYGKLIAIRPIGKTGSAYVWECACDCGNLTNVCVRDLQNGHTKSCGCLKSETRPSLTHGMTKTRIYHIWKDMRQRCNNPNNHAYKRYGERGIKVCEEWENSFENFREWSYSNGYEDYLEIDRINNDGDYEPSNCRWATRKEQMNNVGYNVRLECFGENHTLAEWEDITGISRTTINNRIKNGWKPEDALTIIPILGNNQSTQYTICGMRGRNPNNPSDRIAGSPTEQRLEPNSQGICNTLTSAQKDNMVLESVILTPKRTEYGKAIRKAYESGEIKESRYKMTELEPRTDGIANTLTTVQKDNLLLENVPISYGMEIHHPKKIDVGMCVTARYYKGFSNYNPENAVVHNYRIRKLTPRECYRLMDFSDDDFEKAESVISNSQLYKTAGNSIVRNVLVAIFGQMIPGKESVYKEL